MESPDDRDRGDRPSHPSKRSRNLLNSKQWEDADKPPSLSPECKDEPKTKLEIIDMMAAVQDLHGNSSKDLGKMLKESENFTFHCRIDGTLKQIDAEKFVSTLPLHLLAVILSFDRITAMEHVLQGVRLLHTLSETATHHNRLEQVLSDDVKLLEQIMDLIFFVLIVLAHQRQDNFVGAAPILHPVLVTCCLYLLSSYLSPQWHELVHVLLAHPKVDIFIDSAFGSLHEDIRILKFMLSSSTNEILCDNSSQLHSIKTIQFICQQCEASLQYLLFLCQQKLFQDRVLTNKELCRNGGILSLAQSILKLIVPECIESPDIAACVSRLKSKTLSLLLHLCEAEGTSYLDEVASSPKSMGLGRALALEFIDLLKSAFRRGSSSDDYQKSKSEGLVLINALRLVDSFSDDSNFRSTLITSSVPFLIQVLEIPHEEFISSWCSLNLPVIERDANLEFDPFAAADVALTGIKDGLDKARSSPYFTIGTDYTCPISICNMPVVTYAQTRTSCVVKIIANLDVFVPSLCEEQEKDLFFRTFRKYLDDEKGDLSIQSQNSRHLKARTICRNLGSLTEYAKSLLPNLLNEDDVDLLSKFAVKMYGEYCADLGDNIQDEASGRKETRDADVDRIVPVSLCQEVLGYGVGRSFCIDNDFGQAGVFISEPKAIQIDAPRVHTSGYFPRPVDASRKHCSQEDDKAEALHSDEKQPRKRKRNIMNDGQICAIEKALLEEPEMQKNAALLQIWSDKLSSQGPEITASQLKNWLNNRKARLARAAKENRVPSEEEAQDRPFWPVKSHFSDSESAGEDSCPSTTKGTGNTSIAKCSKLGIGTTNVCTSQVDLMSNSPLIHSSARSDSFEPRRLVTVLDREGKEVGSGQIYQVDGTWHGMNLVDHQICIVDIMELKTDRWKEIPHPSERAGRTFEESATRNGGVMRVAWDIPMVSPLQQHF